MSTQSCSNSKGVRPMNAHQTGKHTLQASYKNCSQRCAYLTGDSCQAFTQSSFPKHAQQQFQPVTLEQPDAFVQLASGVSTVFADSTRKRHTRSGCATLSQKHCVSWTCKICTASEKVPKSSMQSCTSTCITNALELSSRVILVKVHHCMQARHTAALSAHAVCSAAVYALVHTSMPNYVTTVANPNTQADQICFRALTLLQFPKSMACCE